MTLTEISAPALPHEVGEWPDLNDRSIRVELTPTAVKALARLAERWRLSVPEICQLLGGLSESSWHSWQRDTPKSLTVDQLMRVSLLTGIYTALHVLHAGKLADEWIQHPNRNVVFASRTPLDAMVAGGIPVMLQVRALLDGRRGGL